MIQMYLIVQWSANCGLRATKYHGLGESMLKKWRNKKFRFKKCGSQEKFHSLSC